jgi:hypothetical protein
MLQWKRNWLMADSPATRIDWSAAEYVIVELPACPYCGSPRWKRQRTITTKPTSDDGGSIERLAVCLDCRGGYRILTEFPRWGNDVAARAMLEADSRNKP